MVALTRSIAARSVGVDHHGEVFKRLTWFGIGAAAGATGYVWAQQRVRRELDALGPDHLVVVAANQAGRVTRQAARSVAGAVVEGRSAMREREDELISRRDARRGSGRGSDVGADRDVREEGRGWPSADAPRSQPWRDGIAPRGDRRTRPARW